MLFRLLTHYFHAALLSSILFSSICTVRANDARWFKGNLHTHSLWSDGDAYPEVIVDWYKTNGYNFLALSDHNVVQQGQRWTNIETNKGGEKAFATYLNRFGTNWVEQREKDGVREARLKTFDEFRKLFAEKNKFLLLLGEEISDRHLSSPVHMNATNLRELIKPQGGNSVTEVIQNNVNAVLEQRKKTGQPMIPHLNHPNWQWGITAEDLLPIKGEKFFEVYNGHPGVRNDGDDTHASMDRVWDILLTKRLAELKLEPIFGLGTDDSHHYNSFEAKSNNPGRGWIMVKAKELTPKSLISALEAGDFYASSGVQLKNVGRGAKTYSIEIEPQDGVTYTTQFIGTRKGFDPGSEPLKTESGAALRVTHRYSKDIGVVLAEVKGTSASYKLKGDEIYVRARIISSKPKISPIKGEVERAWTQPLVP
ncbi:MAG: hypothetical protein ABIR24_02940 [Verrucomicrobiota bacterium]